MKNSFSKKDWKKFNSEQYRNKIVLEKIKSRAIKPLYERVLLSNLTETKKF